MVLLATVSCYRNPFMCDLTFLLLHIMNSSLKVTDEKFV